MLRSLRSLDLNLLPVFDALMKEQHLSRAATQLSMSQPAVSNALKRLRQSLGDELFVRTAHGLTPTPRAHSVYASVQPALQMIRQGCSEQDFDPASAQTALKLSMNSAVEFLIAPLLTSWLRQSAPDISLSIHPDHIEDIPAQLKDGKLDFAIDYVSYGEHFRHSVLSEETLSVICAEQHPHLNGHISPEQFSSLPQVSLIPRPDQAQKQNRFRGTPIEHLMGDQMPARNLTTQVFSFVAIPGIVAATDQIAVVPTRMAGIFRESLPLQTLPLPFSYPPVEIQLIWHKSRHQDQAHQWFRDGIMQIAEKLQA